MYYDLNKTLTHNCLFNFILGNRGCGKSYGAKKRAIKQFLDKGYHFIYLRRTDAELEETAESYFNDIISNNEFEGHEIIYKGGSYFLDGKLFGHAMALTKSNYYKSISYPLVYLIIFEEFLIEETGYNHYLKNEVNIFLNFYMSIDRYRGCTVFFLANSVTMINPYTVYFDLYLPYNSNIVKKNDVLLQLVNDLEYINNRKNTRFGNMIRGTEFEQYAIENKFVNDKKDFIERKTGTCSYFFSFTYKDDTYGVWINLKEGKLWVSNDTDNTFLINYSFTMQDHSPNTLLINSANKNYHLKTFIEAFKKGYLYFESQRIKNTVYEIIKSLIK